MVFVVVVPSRLVVVVLPSALVTVVGLAGVGTRPGAGVVPVPSGPTTPLLLGDDLKADGHGGVVVGSQVLVVGGGADDDCCGVV